MRLLCIALSVLVILMALFIGYLLWYQIWEVPPKLAYDVLKDTLIIVLTAVTIVVAVVGFAVYQIVSQRLKDETERRIKEETRRWICWLATNTGYSFGTTGSLDEAIRLMTDAEEFAKALDERDPKNQRLICQIRNNLASYFAEAKQNRDLARGYAEYIHRKSHHFPYDREAWEQTYEQVLQAFP